MEAEVTMASGGSGSKLRALRRWHSLQSRKPSAIELSYTTMEAEVTTMASGGSSSKLRALRRWPFLQRGEPSGLLSSFSYKLRINEVAPPIHSLYYTTMEAEVTTMTLDEVTSMALGESSSKFDFQMHCALCGIHKYWTPRMWACDVCRDYYFCENCYKGSLDDREVLLIPPQVQCGDHPMSANTEQSLCDGCGSDPIWNRRWHCKVCPDFDLCEACHGGLDATNMPLEHLKEHPMIAIEVICADMLLSCQPSFTKPVDPQWSYHVKVDSHGYGFVWEKRKAMSKMLSGMDDAITPTRGNAIEDNSVLISNRKDQSTFTFGNSFVTQATPTTQTYGMFDKKHKVFLSHAGAEKDFVAQLSRDLSRVHHFGVFFDKNDDCLPIGEPFPEKIFDAAKNCELAVVVISHEYFIRKWPMLELVAFVEAQKTRPELKILPVFYKLTVKEFKQQQHSFERCWNEKALVSKDEMDAWKEALKVISRTNGLEYDRKMGEVSLRDRIVEAVYKRVKPDLMWDDSHVQGKLRMQETIQEMIRLSSNATEEVLMVSTLRMGLFGMGGSGKTTLCKVWSNQMMPHFLGKVHHMEFGSMDMLLMRLKLLQSVCQLESSVLQTVDEGKALTLLKTHISKQRVCLLIDNVFDSQSCIEEARILLNLPFKEGSLIVVTSRSSIILEALEIEKRLTIRVPSLLTKEAKAMFSYHARCNTSCLSKDQVEAMESFVEQCKFRVQGFDFEEYHPLALKALGSRVGPSAEKWQKIKIDFKYYESRDIHPIFSILRSSFDTLNVMYQRIFLDLALGSGYNHRLTIEGLMWLSECLYGEYDEEFSFRVVEVLQARTLVDFYDAKEGTICVHDLYCEFARMEVKMKGLQHSARCCFSRGSKSHHVVQEGRVRVYDYPISHITKDILSCAICSKAELFTIHDCANLVCVDVPRMKNLKQFDVIRGCPQLTRVNLEGAVNLRSFSWREFDGKYYPNLTSMESLKILVLCDDEAPPPTTLHGCLDFSKSTNLELLHLSYLPLKMLNLNQAVLLKKLYLRNCQHIERFEGLEDLVHLETLKLEACSSLMEFPSLANFPSLKIFWLRGAAKMKQIRGFAYSNALVLLSLEGGMELQGLPGIEACLKLSNMWLNGTGIRDCSWISTVKDLIVINLCGTKIRSLPNCSCLSKLLELWVDDCQALESIGDNMDLISPTFPQSLQKFSARNCQSLNALPNFHYKSTLCYLDVQNTSINDLSGTICCTQLRTMFCGETQITSLPDLGSLTRLEVLDVHGCKLLTKMDNIKSLPALTKLWVYGCTTLSALPDLRSSMGLKQLSLIGCPLVDPNTLELPSASVIPEFEM